MTTSTALADDILSQLIRRIKSCHEAEESQPADGDINVESMHAGCALDDFVMEFGYEIIDAIAALRKSPPGEAEPTFESLLNDAIEAMQKFHDTAYVVIEDGQAPAFPPAAFREFVDAHARLLYERQRVRKPLFAAPPQAEQAKDGG